MAKNSNKKEKKVAKSNIKEEKIEKTDSKKVSKEKDTKKNKKSGFKDFKAELKKVVWPTPKELANSTSAVIAIVIVTAIIVLILDLAFELFNTYGIEQLRSVYSASQTVEEDTTSNEATEEIIENSENTTEESINTDTTNDTTVDSGTEEDSANSEVTQ